MSDTTEPMEPIFLYSKTNGDMNVNTYSKKKGHSKKNYPAYNYFFTPNKDADSNKIKSEINRGMTFFTQRDGMLFGAIVELRKLGTISERFAG